MFRPPGLTAYSIHFKGSDIAAEELRFLLAMHAYQRCYRRRYPTWREVLYVARSLGYRKIAPAPPLHSVTPPPSGVRSCCSRAS